jgi:hypothetical protein
MALVWYFIKQGLFVLWVIGRKTFFFRVLEHNLDTTD